MLVGLRRADGPPLLVMASGVERVREGARERERVKERCWGRSDITRVRRW